MKIWCSTKRCSKKNTWSFKIFSRAVLIDCLGPIHWETNLREACASLRGVKGSLREGVLFGIAWVVPRGFILPASLKKVSKSASASLLTGELSCMDTQSAHAAYATKIIFRYCDYCSCLFFMALSCQNNTQLSLNPSTLTQSRNPRWFLILDTPLG